LVKQPGAREKEEQTSAAAAERGGNRNINIQIVKPAWYIGQ